MKRKLWYLVGLAHLVLRNEGSEAEMNRNAHGDLQWMEAWMLKHQ